MVPENLIIFNYHKIEEKPDIGITTRTPDDFYNDIKIILDQGFLPITFQNILDNEVPDKPIILTFDDGYFSFYKYAFPFLAKNNIPAVVYIPTDFLGKENNWDVQIGLKRYRHMNESEVLEISKNNIEIGSHSCSHILLNNMSDEEINYQITNSKNVIEKITGKTVHSLSYPFGRYNFRVVEQIKELYPFAVALTKPFAKMNVDNRYYLNRLNVYRFEKERSIKNKLKNYSFYKIRDWIVQNGSWATMLMQKLKQTENTLDYEAANR